MLRWASQLQQAFSNSGIAAVRQQIDKLQTESAEALKILEAQLSEQFSGQMSAVELKQAATAAELRKALDAELAGAQAALRERLSEVLEQLPELDARLDDQKGQIEAVRTRQDVNYDAVESLQASHARAAQEASKISSRVEQILGMMSEEQRIREAETTQVKQGIRELEATQATLTTQLEDFGGVLETVQRSASDADDMLSKRLGDVSKRLETVQAVQAEQRAEAEEHKADLQRLHNGLHDNTVLAERHRAEVDMRVEDLQRLTIPLEEQMHAQEEALGKLASDQQARQLKEAAVQERFESERAARELQRRELLGVVARERKAFERLTVLEQSLLAVDELARREMEARARDTRRLWDALDNVSDPAQDVEASLPSQPLTSFLRLGGRSRHDGTELRES